MDIYSRKNFIRPQGVILKKIFISNNINPVLPPISNSGVVLRSLQEAGVDTAGFAEHVTLKSNLHVEWPKLIINYSNAITNSSNGNSALPVIDYVVPNSQLVAAVNEVQSLQPGINGIGHLLDTSLLFTNGGNLNNHLNNVSQMRFADLREIINIVGPDHFLVQADFYAYVQNAIIHAAVDELTLLNCVDRLWTVYVYNPEFIAILGLIIVPTFVGSIGVSAALLTTIDWESHMRRSLHFFSNLRETLYRRHNAAGAAAAAPAPIVEVERIVITRHQQIMVHGELNIRGNYVVEMDPFTYRIYSMVRDYRFFVPLSMFSLGMYNYLTPERIAAYGIKETVAKYWGIASSAVRSWFNRR